MAHQIRADQLTTGHALVGRMGGMSRVLNVTAAHEYKPLLYNVVTEHVAVQVTADHMFNVEQLQAWSIPVVFDMEPTLTREEAARKLCKTLEDCGLPDTPDITGVESWWFPEPEDKHIDGNDNDAMCLVDVDWNDQAMDMLMTHNLVERAGNEPFDDDCRY